MKLFTVLALSGLALGFAQQGDPTPPPDEAPVLDPDDPANSQGVLTTVVCNVENCITCHEANKCQSCEEGYSSVSGVCSPCSTDDCAVCDSDVDTCQQCSTGFYLSSESFTTQNVNGTQEYAVQSCVACTITGCGECVVDSSGDETCDACAEGYYKAQDESCAECGENCDECADVDPQGNIGGCLQCVEGWEPEILGDCGQIGFDCGDNCDDCEEHNQCKTCADGYAVMLFNNGDSIGCYPCPPNCATCADAETCDVCEDGFTLDDTSGSCATPEQVVANVCYCATTVNDGCTCPGDENDAKDGCCDAGGLCGGDDGVCSLYNNDVCSDFDNCAYCFGQSFCGMCDEGYYKTNGHPWGACILLPDGWTCDTSLLYNDQCECGCGGVDPECAAHQVDNCDTTDGGVYCDADGECASCTLDGCLYCENGDSPTECHECMSGYDLNDDNTECIKCDIDGCDSCGSGVLIVDGEVVTGTVCKTCMDGYYGSIAEGTCTACDDANCASCSATGCNKCMDGFSLDIESGTCNECSENCLSCGASQCNRCASGYDVIGGVCVSEADGCGNNCDTCQRGGQCKICEAGYYVGAGTNGKCVGCIDNCDTCRDGSSCSSCSDGYQFDTDAGCIAEGECLADNCDCRADVDAASNDGCTCLESETSAKFGCCNADCGLCSDFCADYDESPCTEIDNCEYCFGQSYCTECAEGYYQAEIHGDCVALPDGWDLSLCALSLLGNNECDCECGGYDPDCDEEPADGCDDYQYCSVDGQCSDCNVAGCNHCANGLEHETNEGECLECTDGHYSDEDGNCFDCNLDGCAVCLLAEGGGGDQTSTTDPNSYSCKECSDGYYMNNEDLCSQCEVTNCAVCSLDGSCEECADGYSITDDGACSGCIDNCIDCTGDIDSCKRCADNYEVLEDGTCGSIGVDCGDDCYICGAQGICKQCMNTFYKKADSTCAACMDNCGSCTNANDCSECETGYGYDNGACSAYSDALAYCDEMIKDNVFSEGTECVCEGWECAAVEDTTTTTLGVRGRE